MEESFCGTIFYVDFDDYIHLNMETNCTEHGHAHAYTQNLVKQNKFIICLIALGTCKFLSYDIGLQL